MQAGHKTNEIFCSRGLGRATKSHNESIFDGVEVPSIHIESLHRSFGAERRYGYV